MACYFLGELFHKLWNSDPLSAPVPIFGELFHILWNWSSWILPFISLLLVAEFIFETNWLSHKTLVYYTQILACGKILHFFINLSLKMSKQFRISLIFQNFRNSSYVQCRSCEVRKISSCLHQFHDYLQQRKVTGKVTIFRDLIPKSESHQF